MLNPNLEKGQFAPSLDELSADAVFLLIAGTDTTAHALIVATYSTLTNPSVLANLKAELREAMPNKDSLLDWAALEKLPFLVQYFSLVLYFEVADLFTAWHHQRIPTLILWCSWQSPTCSPSNRRRLLRAEDSTRSKTLFEDPLSCYPLPWLINIHVQTLVSCCVHVHHTDPDVFEDPTVFRPERWLANDANEMEKNLLSFSRGSRMCPGMKYVIFLLASNPQLFVSLYRLSQNILRWSRERFSN